MKIISSKQNPLIRFIQSLEKRKQRDESQLFLVEGERETAQAIQSAYVIQQLLFCEQMISLKEVEALVKNSAQSPELLALSKEVFDLISYRDSAARLMAVVQQKKLKLSDLHLSPNPLLLVLETIEKPGNLGAILRTADAIACDAVIVCDPRTDIFNPNVIRSGIGSFFTNQLAVCSSSECIEFLKSKGIRIFTTSLEASHWYHLCDYSGPSAVVMGSEAQGVSATMLEAADERIKIPMLGKMDSMNVSVSAAVVLFEAGRQRQFKVSK